MICRYSYKKVVDADVIDQNRGTAQVGDKDDLSGYGVLGKNHKTAYSDPVEVRLSLAPILITDRIGLLSHTLEDDESFSTESDESRPLLNLLKQEICYEVGYKTNN